MSIESNRAIAVKFYDLMSQLKFKEMFELMADDATWRVVGNPKTFWPAGTRTKAERVQLFGDFAKTFKSMEAKILNSTAEDDRVALESTMKAVTHSGLVYENEYLLLLRFRDNKIIFIYEMLDQQATLEFVKAVEAENAK